MLAGPNFLIDHAVYQHALSVAQQSNYQILALGLDILASEIIRKRRVLLERTGRTIRPDVGLQY